MSSNVIPTHEGILRVEHRVDGVSLHEDDRFVTKLERFEGIYWCDDLDLELLLPLASAGFPGQLYLHVASAGRFAVGPFDQIRAHDAIYGLAALTFVASIAVSEWDGQLSLDEYLSRVSELAIATGEFVVTDQDFYGSTKLLKLTRRCTGGTFADEVKHTHMLLADIVEDVYA